jgi:2-dehydro-3-deoxyphosphogluconate aldolase/(4S)-4-hydroxy-2-oxoglutarate aldolase
MKTQFSREILQRIEHCGVIAVLVIDAVKDAVPLARALVDGGIDVMELTLRTPVALDALVAIRAEVPDMLAGIGTILTPEQVQRAHAAGAAFGVAPGTNRRVIEAARGVSLPFAPGIATPSDLELALELGCPEVKFFPAEPCGGLEYLRSISAPYLHLGVRFIPLGGVKLENVGAYLIDPLVLAVGGSWLAPRNLVQAGDWLSIRQLASTARSQVDRLRQWKEARPQ